MQKIISVVLLLVSIKSIYTSDEHKARFVSFAELLSRQLPLMAEYHTKADEAINSIIGNGLTHTEAIDLRTWICTENLPLSSTQKQTRCLGSLCVLIEHGCNDYPTLTAAAWVPNSSDSRDDTSDHWLYAIEDEIYDRESAGTEIPIEKIPSSMVSKILIARLIHRLRLGEEKEDSHSIRALHKSLPPVHKGLETTVDSLLKELPLETMLDELKLSEETSQPQERSEASE